MPLCRPVSLQVNAPVDEAVALLTAYLRLKRWQACKIRYLSARCCALYRDVRSGWRPHRLALQVGLDAGPSGLITPAGLLVSAEEMEWSKVNWHFSMTVGDIRRLPVGAFRRVEGISDGLLDVGPGVLGGEPAPDIVERGPRKARDL